MLETPVFSTAAVAAPHRRAAEIGQTILASGGNAVEAVIAMAATCAVVLPHLNGLGGDAFFLVREPRGRVHAIDASGPAGALATIERYRQKEYDAIPAHGPDAALTVAGVVGGWSLGLELARALGGQLPLDMLLADAIGLARDGYAVSASETRAAIDDSPAERRGRLPMRFLSTESARRPATFADCQSSPTPSSACRMWDFSISIVAMSGAKSRSIWSGSRAPIVRRDLETYRARVVQPLSVRLRHATIYNLPPPSQGFGSLLALAIADRLGLRHGENAAYHHGMIEATKRALALRDRFIADPREVEQDLADLLSAGLPGAGGRPDRSSARGECFRCASPRRRRCLDRLHRQGRSRGVLRAIRARNFRIGMRAAEDRHSLAQSGHGFLARCGEHQCAGAGPKAISYPQPGAGGFRRSSRARLWCCGTAGTGADLLALCRSRNGTRRRGRCAALVIGERRRRVVSDAAAGGSFRSRHHESAGAARPPGRGDWARPTPMRSDMRE